MGTKEYIESGVLDLYVSGLLSVEEMRDVELKACQNTDVKLELEMLQSALERFVMKHSMIPNPRVKDKILKDIYSNTATHKSSAIFSSSKKTLYEEPDLKTDNSRAPAVHKMPLKKNYSLVAAASITLLAVMTGLSFYFYDQYRQSKEQIADLEEQQLNVGQLVSQMQTDKKQNKEKLKVLTDANMVRVTMKGTKKSPESMAMVYWNKDTKAVYLDIKVLPPVPDAMQYQLWSIDPTKGPVNAGMISTTNGEIIKMIDAPGAVAFAVTLEPQGGSKTPTLKEMVVMGTVSS